METNDPYLRLRLAVDPVDILGAQRLRYTVFVQELGAKGVQADHESRFESDRFDSHCVHLVLEDIRRSNKDFDHIVGAYRLLTQSQADKVGHFYSESEYDLTPLKSRDLNLLELGRSCLHPDYRGGMAMYHLWTALTKFAAEHDIDILFGVASFHGTSIEELSAPLSYLHHYHLAHQNLRVRSKLYQNMGLTPKVEIDRVAALRAIPALIKAYIRLGGVVGDGAFVDQDFNTTDVCLVMDRNKVNRKQRAIYDRASA